ncbi:unnamed protein product, partial [marine sediment metagenome]
GNHEYYNHDLQEIEYKLQNYEYPQNVVYLNQNVYIDHANKVIFYGCCLWSDNNTELPFQTKNNMYKSASTPSTM